MLMKIVTAVHVADNAAAGVVDREIAVDCVVAWLRPAVNSVALVCQNVTADRQVSYCDCLANQTFRDILLQEGKAVN